MNLAEFHFLRPLWLLALLPLALLAWRLRPARREAQGWQSVCDASLLPHVLVAREGSRRSGLRYGLTAAAALAVLALAGPAWERLPVPVFRDDASLVVVLDLSRSMDAADLSPSRLAQARFEVADLLGRGVTSQTALVVYALQAYAVTPLTTDAQTLVAQLPVLATDLVPAQGSRAERGVQKAAALLEQAGVNGGEVLLVTDGVDERAARAIQTLAAERDLRVSVLGVGTAEGAPIPLPGGGFVQAPGGGPVLTRLEEAPLRRLAEATGGRYVTAGADEGDVQQLADWIGRPGRPRAGSQPTTEEGEPLRAELWRDQGPWLLLAALPLAALAFRRGAGFALVLLCLPLARPAHALEWAALWQRPDQQAREALEAGDAAQAAQRFEDPAWKSAALYRAGDFEAALEALSGRVDADSLYNRGNALARLGRYQEAIAAYSAALAADPGHEDARYNREVVEKALQAQSPPPQGGAGSPPEEQSEPSEQSSEAQSGGGSASQSDGARGEGSPEAQAEPEPQGAQAEASPSPGEDGEETQAGRELPQESPEGQEQQSEAEQAAARTERGEEDARATEQWLRRVPDDPGGLLRRKFQLQSRREGDEAPEEPAW